MNRIRSIYLLVACLVALGPAIGATAPALAQGSTQTPDATTDNAPGPELGPVVKGRHRQPTQSEIEEREREQGRSAESIAREQRAKDREVEELYRQLTREPSGTPPAESGSTR